MDELVTFRYDSPMNTPDGMSRVLTTQAIADWVRWARAGGLAPASLNTYRPYIREFFETYGVEYYDAKPEHFVDWAERLNQRGRTSSLVAFRSMSHFYRWLRTRGLVETNPVEFMPHAAPTLKVPSVFTREQLDELWIQAKHVGGAAAELHLKMLYYTGARRTESLGLTLDDMGEDFVVIRDTKRRPGGSQRERSIPLGSLSAKQTAGRAITEINRKDGDARLFPWTYRTLNYWCEDISSATGFHVHPHKFRATFATNMLRAGKDIRTVSELLGHASIQTTMRYLAVLDEWKLDATAAL